MKTIILLLTLFIAFGFSLPKPEMVHVHCTSLLELIRCISTDTVMPKDGKLLDANPMRSTYLLNYRILDSTVAKRTFMQNHKLQHQEMIILTDKQSEADYTRQLFAELKTCLNTWKVDSFAPVKGSMKLHDYLFTNSEDETSVRLTSEQPKKQPCSITILVY